MARSMMFFIREEPRSRNDNGMGNELTIEVLLVLFLLFGSARNFAFFVDYIKLLFSDVNARGEKRFGLCAFPLARSPDGWQHNSATITDNLVLVHCINSELSFPIIPACYIASGNKEFFSSPRSSSSQSTIQTFIQMPKGI